jgi:hypothetical protein
MIGVRHQNQVGDDWSKTPKPSATIQTIKNWQSKLPKMVINEYFQPNFMLFFNTKKTFGPGASVVTK